jgi:hypothetical protein
MINSRHLDNCNGVSFEFNHRIINHISNNFLISFNSLRDIKTNLSLISLKNKTQI